MDIDKKDLYEIALNEVERRDDSFSRGIWALALVQCDGDEEKAKIKYISLRVEELTSESKIDSLVKKDEQKIDELMGGASLPVEGIDPYILKADELYMSDEQHVHFRLILVEWKKQLMKEVDRTEDHMKTDVADYVDLDDRELKLINKIDESLKTIDSGKYGYCESCGIEIGIRRLEARPTATLCIDCKTLQEIKEKEIYDESTSASNSDIDRNEFEITEVATQGGENVNKILDIEIESSQMNGLRNYKNHVNQNKNFTTQSVSVSRQDKIEALEKIGFIIEKLDPELYIYQKNYARLTFPDRRKVSFRSKDDFYYGITRIYKKYILEKNTYSSHDDILESKSQIKNQGNFLSKIYQGGYSLPVTYWFFGVGVNIIFRILDEIIFKNSSNATLALLFLLLNTAYLFLICVGIWRAADNYNGEHYWSTLAKCAVIFSIATLLIPILG